MSDSESVSAWLVRLKAAPADQSRSSDEAATLLWHRYVESLARLAQRKLAGLPQRVADDEDVVLSAFAAFLKGVEDGRFAQLYDRNDLWQVLVMLTERKAIALRRQHHAAKRGAGQVRGESVFLDHQDRAAHPDGLQQAGDCHPTPEFAAEMAENLRQLLEQLGDPTLQRIALGKLEGHTNAELAQQLKISRRAIERKLSLIRRRWQKESTP